MTSVAKASAFIGRSLTGPFSSGIPVLPAGVTLQNIDGGPAYYSSNGFTNAAVAGWDSQSFFPVIDDFSFYPSNSTTTFKALGLNTSVRCTDDTDMSALRAAGVWAILDGFNTNFGTETLAWHVEEPDNWTGDSGAIVNQVQSFNPDIPGRFIQPSFTFNQFVYGGWADCPCGPSMPDAMYCAIATTQGSVTLATPSDDIYWFAGSTDTEPFGTCYDGAQVYGSPTNLTEDQMARGSNYGDMVDQMREWLTPPYAPCAPYIETEDGLIGHPGVRRILPPEFNWAVWSTIIHGARMAIYFGTTSNFGSTPTFGFNTGIQSGQSVSMYTQGQATNTTLGNIAPVINSPFALNFASVSPGGYTFPVPHVVLDDGLEICAKYYGGAPFTNATGTFGPGLYILCDVRGSETQTDIAATFTLAPGSYTGSIPVIRNLGLPGQSPGSVTATVSGGQIQFTDTFATAYDVHLYGPIP